MHNPKRNDARYDRKEEYRSDEYSHSNPETLNVFTPFRLENDRQIHSDDGHSQRQPEPRRVEAVGVNKHAQQPALDRRAVEPTADR